MLINCVLKLTYSTYTFSNTYSTVFNIRILYSIFEYSTHSSIRIHTQYIIVLKSSITLTVIRDQTHQCDDWSHIIINVNNYEVMNVSDNMM